MNNLTAHIFVLSVGLLYAVHAGSTTTTKSPRVRCKDGSLVLSRFHLCPNGCRYNQYRCTGTKMCVDYRAVCETTETTTNSAAMTTTKSVSSSSTTTTKSPRVRCKDGSFALSRFHRCANGCRYNQYRCPGTKMCVDYRAVCGTTTTKSPRVQCKDGSFVLSRFHLCPNGCTYNKYNCPGTTKCMYYKAFCDLLYSTTAKPGYKCKDGSWVTDRLRVCQNGCFYNHYRCPGTKKQCVSSKLKCRYPKDPVIPTLNLPSIPTLPDDSSSYNSDYSGGSTYTYHFVWFLILPGFVVPCYWARRRNAALVRRRMHVTVLDIQTSTDHSFVDAANPNDMQPSGDPLAGDPASPPQPPPYCIDPPSYDQVFAAQPGDPEDLPTYSDTVMLVPPDRASDK